MTQKSTDTILPDNLVSTEWLASHLDAESLRIVDIRGYVIATDLGDGLQSAVYTGAKDEYDLGHIPNSSYIDWTVDIVDLMNHIKAQIASPDAFAAAMESRGIGNDSDVVIVDHTGGHFATRFWWALGYYGHHRAAVLDGGFNKWAAEGQVLTEIVPEFEPGSFHPVTRPETRVDAEDVVAAIGQPGSLIVDARDAPTFNGEIRRHSRGGHVPSAVNIPAKSLVESNGTWKPVAELDRILRDGGVTGEQHVIAYCNGGVTATAVLFALARTGHTNFANYDGSWNEWGDRPDLPVEPVEPTASS